MHYEVRLTWHKGPWALESMAYSINTAMSRRGRGSMLSIVTSDSHAMRVQCPRPSTQSEAEATSNSKELVGSEQT